MAPLRLVADIGGTNARFALVLPGSATLDVAVLPVAQHGDFDAALETFLAMNAGAEIGSAALAAAGPKDGNSVALTNAPWRIDGQAVSERLGGVPVRILNDLEAVALALPLLEPGDFETLLPAGTGPTPLPMLAANVGTGFGAAVAIPLAGSTWCALTTEAGHMSLAPSNPEEAAFLHSISHAEGAFSGGGHAALFATTSSDGSGAPKAADGTRNRQIYSQIFGRFVGDLVLATGSWGGVHFCGGVLSEPGKVLDLATFSQAFRDKGKMTARLKGVPVHHIKLESPALRYLLSEQVF